MRLGFLTTGVFLAALVLPAMADGCGDACDCPVKAPKHSVTQLPAHPAPLAAPAVHHAVRHVARGDYYNYAAAGVVREGYGHSLWRVAPNDGQVPNLGPQPMCCAPMAYAPPAEAYGPPPGAYGQPVYGPPPGAYADAGDPSMRINDKTFEGGVGADVAAGGGGGGGFMDGFGQVHYANGGGEQNGPTYNNYSQSFQSNPSVPGVFQNRLMGGLAPATTSSSSSSK